MRSISDCRGQRISEDIVIPLRVHVPSEENADNSYSFQFRGRLIPSILSAPSMIDFGLNSVAGTKATRTVSITANTHVYGFDVISPSSIRGMVTRSNSREANTYQLQMSIVDSEIPWTLDEVVTLIPLTRNGERLPPVDIRCKGEISPDTIAVPSIVPFGRRQVGTEAEEMIRFRSLTGAAFTIDGVEGGNNPAIMTHRIADDKSTSLIKVRFTHTGEQQTSIPYRIVDANGKRLTVPVSVTYLGWSD